MSVKKKRDERRKAPDLSADEELTQAEIRDGQALEYAHVTGGDFSGQKLQQLAARYSVIEGVSFAQANLASVRLRDLRLLRCDFSNAVARGLEASRVEFVDCRLIGLKAIECRMEDILLERCDVRYAQFNDGAAKYSDFVDSQLQEADFRGTNLENTIWTRTDLSRADFRGAKLAAADLRGAEIEGLLVEAADLPGAVVNPSQAMEFARLLGLIIR